MFLSNWLVFKIVLAAVTGLVDYPLAVDVLLVYDNANKLYLSGGSLEYVSNVVLYKGEASYEISESSQLVTNYYITQPGTYRADLQICGIDYKTNEVEVTGSVTPEKTWGNEQKLLGETAGDNFGYSVSISGDYAIVGAPYEDTGASSAGATYIYTRSVTTWGNEQKILGETAGDYFGYSVSIRGDYAIVGAPYEDTGASSAGAAYIYTRSGTTWGNEQKLLGEVASDFFGWSVAIDGGNAIVGAQYEDTGASNAGAAYIYELTPVAGLTFDGYNQLSLTNTPTYRSSKLAYGSNVYDVGTLTDKLFIEKTGEYTSLTFDTSSNVAYFSNISIQNVNVISDYIDEYGIADYSTYNGANNAGWTMDEWSLRPLRWNRDDRNNSLYVPVPASSSDPFAIDTLFHFYVQSLVANGFSSNGENFPFPTKNGVLWEVDMKNIELSCYNNNARVTGSSLESTYGIGGNTFFQLQCNKNNTNDVNIYIYYSRTSSTGKIFDFWWSISNKNNSVNNSETICLIQNVDLSNDTVLKYGWYKFDKTEGKPEFYISVGGQTVSEKVSFSLNNAYKDFHDETYGGCEVADPVSPDNSNYDSPMGWPFRHFMASGTRAAVGDNNTSEARTDLKRGLIFDMMYFKYNNVFEKIPKIDFDGYNKLSIENITPTATTLRLGSNTYDIGTASNVYIEDTGTYQIETKDANTFALVSNVVTGTISPHPTDAFPSLTHDGYNKLSIENITPTSTTLTDPNGSSFDIGTTTDIYIEDSGTYEAGIKDANTFALVSNVVGTVTQVAVYDYTQAGTTEQKIQASDKQANDNFGYSVSISGDYAIVGALGEDTGATDAGAAYIYTRDASTGVWG